MWLMMRGLKVYERDLKWNDGDLMVMVGFCCFLEGKVGYEIDE